MYSLKEIAGSLPEEKKQSDGLWTKIVLRPLSLPFVWIALRLRIKANTVSYISAFFSVSGGILFGTRGFWTALAGAILLNIFSILDCADGTVARVTKTSSLWGGWADAVMGFVAYTAVFLSSGVYVYLRTGWWEILLISGFTSSANLLTRVAYQISKNIVGAETAHKSVSFERKLAETVGITGFMMPLLIVFHCADIFNDKISLWGMIAIIAFNFAFYSGGCFFTLVKIAKQAEKSRKDRDE